ncbi:phosphatase PAP2 family protein [Paraburkholderia sp.]|uniref:phosphatase PAP2 family protein n=1 Tax=Paraburkholderia sp. TaxID=1926495 RepID=UPI003C723176
MSSTPMGSIGRGGMVARLDLKWSMLAAVMVLDAVWMIRGRWSIQLESVRTCLLIVLAFAAPLAFRRIRQHSNAVHFCEAMAFSLLFAKSGAVLSYLVVTTNFPLVDGTLAAMDKRLGFDWLSYYRSVGAHPYYHRAIRFAYTNMVNEIWFVAAFLSFTGRLSRLRAFLQLSSVTLLVAIFVSLFFPAASAAKYFQAQTHVGVPGFSQFEPLRAGTLTTIDLNAMQGLVSMPSFHTIMAILFCWAVRRTPAALVLIPLNIALVLATPTEGGHYLVDVIAGAVVAFCAIAVLDRREAKSVSGLELKQTAA